MKLRNHLAWAWLPLCAALFIPSALTPACCPATMKGHSVVNADQTVTLIWDPATQTQHFIRQASFKSDGADVGFIVPSPSEPELAESNNRAFSTLASYTAPKVVALNRSQPRSTGFGCRSETSTMAVGAKPTVEVLQQKEVAGFNAVVLSAESSDALAEWLTEHGYEFSPEMAVWAKPYIEQGWKFTALKVASKETEAVTAGSAPQHQLNAPALRISFQTERPLFPYREPDMTAHAEQLAAKKRLLRIYFLSNQQYQGSLDETSPWTGRVAWSNRLTDFQSQAVWQQLALSGPSVASWWLTEFEDYWPYQPAPADLYFAPTKDNRVIERPIQYVQAKSSSGMDVMPVVILFALVAPNLWLRLRGR